MLPLELSKQSFLISPTTKESIQHFHEKVYPFIYTMPQNNIEVEYFSSPFAEFSFIILFMDKKFYLEVLDEIYNCFTVENVFQMHNLHTIAWEIEDFLDPSTQSLIHYLSSLPSPPSLIHEGKIHSHSPLYLLSSFSSFDEFFSLLNISSLPATPIIPEQTKEIIKFHYARVFHPQLKTTNSKIEKKIRSIITQVCKQRITKRILIFPVEGKPKSMVIFENVVDLVYMAQGQEIEKKENQNSLRVWTLKNQNINIDIGFMLDHNFGVDLRILSCVPGIYFIIITLAFCIYLRIDKEKIRIRFIGVITAVKNRDVDFMRYNLFFSNSVFLFILILL